MPETKHKIRAKTANEVCKQFQLSAEGAALLTEAADPLEFPATLARSELFVDAATYLAYGLPRREAVWWSCSCARALGLAPGSAALAAVEAAELWVRKPTDENRRAAEAKSVPVKETEPAHWAALAAFWSEGSLAPPDAPPVPTKPEFAAKAILGAIQLAVAPDPAKRAERFRQFLAWGLDVAKGGTGRPATNGATGRPAENGS